MLATHENPDGDALGSLVAMQGLLKALGKDTVMFISPEDCRCRTSTACSSSTA